MLAFVLVCALGQRPWECTPYTAREVVKFPTEAKLPYACLIEAQEHAAVSRFNLKSDEWLKVGCEPRY